MKDNKKITLQYVDEKLIEWTNEGTDSPSLLISKEDGSYHLGYYAGMGNSDNTPIEKLEPLFKKTIIEYYQSGKLKESGKTFSLYPGSGFFRKLVFEY
jgi:hypothetical protein